MMSDDVSFLSQLVRDSMELQAEEAISQSEYQESNIMEPMQVLENNDFASGKCSWFVCVCERERERELICRTYLNLIEFIIEK